MKQKILVLIILQSYIIRDDNGAGWDKAGPKDGVFVLVQYGFVLPIPAPPRMTKKLSHPIPVLQAPRNPALPRKTLLFVNLPYNQYNFFNETYLTNKNILEITTKFILSNQINFQKKLNNISKCLTRQSHTHTHTHTNKNSHSITHNKKNAENHIKQNKIS